MNKRPLNFRIIDSKTRESIFSPIDVYLGQDDNLYKFNGVSKPIKVHIYPNILSRLAPYRDVDDKALYEGDIISCEEDSWGHKKYHKFAIIKKCENNFYISYNFGEELSPCHYVTVRRN